MKARDVFVDVLAPVAFFQEKPGTKGEMADRLQATQLAATPEGEGVYIAPDGTLMRVEPHDGWQVTTDDDGDPTLAVRDDLYILVPIEGADDA